VLPRKLKTETELDFEQNPMQKESQCAIESDQSTSVDFCDIQARLDKVISELPNEELVIEDK
jgi:hypothetical protein